MDVQARSGSKQISARADGVRACEAWVVRLRDLGTGTGTGAGSGSGSRQNVVVGACAKKPGSLYNDCASEVQAGTRFRFEGGRQLNGM